MIPRSNITHHGLILLCAVVSFISAAQMPKKGVGTWYMSQTKKAMTDISVSASWFYTWAPDTNWSYRPASMQFVPMIWDETHVTTVELDKSKASGSGILLGYNEPDRTDQADMGVTQALDLWPQLAATGLRLGSPAPASNGATPGQWLDLFMSGAQTRGYRVDFVCVHWYASDFNVTNAVANLRSYLQAVYDRYKKPVWLTEFAMISWESGTIAFPPTAQQAAFATASVAMLETLSFVERYAWFSLPPYGAGSNNNLYDSLGNATPAGIAYRNATAPPTRTLRILPGVVHRTQGDGVAFSYALNGSILDAGSVRKSGILLPFISAPGSAPATMRIIVR